MKVMVIAIVIDMPWTVSKGLEKKPSRIRDQINDLNYTDNSIVKIT